MFSNSTLNKKATSQLILPHLRVTLQQPRYKETPDGKTPLHQLIQSARTTNEINQYLEKAPEKAVIHMALFADNKGVDPLTALVESSFPSNEKMATVRQLLRFAICNDAKPLNYPICFEKIIERYPETQQSECIDNLRIACVIANYARSYITQSSTHPDSNSLSFKDQKAFEEKITALRAPLKQQWIYQNGLDLYEKLIAPFVKTHAGNCQEIALFCWFLCKLFDPAITANIYQIHPGDHAIVIIGTGQNAIICDAWTGKVFPAYAILNKLKVHKSYTINQEKFHFVTPVNLNYHKIALHDHMALFEQLLEYTGKPPLYETYRSDLSCAMESLSHPLISKQMQLR